MPIDFTEARLAQMRQENNPAGEPTGLFTGRCEHCGSRDLWDDATAYGCNCCGSVFYTGDILPCIVPTAGVTVLLPYGFWFDEPCVCGQQFASVVAGPADSGYHVVKCWCGATRQMAANAEELHAALRRHASGVPGIIRCPACDEVGIREDDLAAQIEHMQTHPEFLEERRRQVAPGFSDV